MYILAPATGVSCHELYLWKAPCYYITPFSSLALCHFLAPSDEFFVLASLLMADKVAVSAGTLSLEIVR